MPSKEMMSKCHVISVISNPVRYRSRYDLYEQFERHMEASGAQLHVVELAFGDRPYEIDPDPAHTQLIRFRTLEEVWAKENLINLAISRLPEDWQYVLWVDADVHFTDPHWLTESVQALQHWHVIQLFSEAIDLGPKNEVMQVHTGFVKAYFDNGFKNPNKKGNGTDYYGYGGKRGSHCHPGFCWGATRYAIDSLGGLIDWAILGSGDHNMALALIGEAEKTFPGTIHDRYKAKILRWQDRALKYIQKDIGYLHGVITHAWHGKKADRGYIDRWKILLDNEFDPDADLKRDSQGLIGLTERNHRLRDEIRAYFRSRREDSIDL